MTEPSNEHPGGSPLEVGYVAGAHGVHGTVRIHLHDAASTALGPGRRVMLRHDQQPDREYEVGNVAAVPGKANRRRVVLVGIGDRDAADALRGYAVVVARDQLPPLAEGEFYLVDAIGLPVQREHEGITQALGTITGLTTNGAQDLFEVSWRGPEGRARQWLLPVLSQYILDQGAERVLVQLPLGMLPEGLEPATEQEVEGEP